MHIFHAFRRRYPRSTLFPYTTLFRSHCDPAVHVAAAQRHVKRDRVPVLPQQRSGASVEGPDPAVPAGDRSEEHTSELQSRSDLVCRLLLEKNNLTCLYMSVGYTFCHD